MINIKYKKGNLFDHVQDTDLVIHACNGQGVWGSGFAAELKKRKPEVFEEFVDYLTLQRKRYSPVGWQYTVYSDDSYSVANIVTSNGYGPFVDKPPDIVESTRVALLQALMQFLILPKMTMNVVSPKINAGLFKVPWKDTEKMILQAIEISGKTVDWTVYEL